MVDVCLYDIAIALSVDWGLNDVFLYGDANALGMD